MAGLTVCVRSKRRTGSTSAPSTRTTTRRARASSSVSRLKGGRARAASSLASRSLRARGAPAHHNEISQRDLANHLSDLAAQPAERLDGGEWGPLAVTQSDQIEESFEVRASPRQTDVTEIAVRNDFNTFAPFRCALVPGSSSSFSVTPNHGSMNRRSGDPVDVTVRFTPQETGVVHEAYLIFETEDMKKVYHFTGST